MYNGNASTSHYTEYGTLPTMTEAQKEQVLTEPYVLPEAGAETLGGVLQAENVAASEATTVAALKGTVNDILSALKAAGIMAADPEEEQAET